MSGLPYAKNFRELEVYKRARELAEAVFEISKHFPKEERYSLTDQIRRASRSVGAQIAESWGKRRYPRHFISKLSDADGEQYETQHWIEIASDSGYIDESTRQGLIDLCLQIGRMLGSMISKAEGFSGDPPTRMQEDPLPYLSTLDP